MAVLKVIVDILSQPPILIGLVAMVGLIAQRKAIESIITGTLKTTIGILIIGGGAGIVIGAISPLGTILEQGFGIKGVIAVNEVVLAVGQGHYGREIAFMMVGAFAVNLILALITRYKYVFLTGHHILFMATCGALAMGAAGVPTTPMIIIGSVATGIAAIVFPAMSRPFMRKITGGDDYVLGHWGTFGYSLSGWIGSVVGNPEDSTEDLTLPKWANFMREPLIAMGTVMLVVYLVATIAAGPSFVAEIGGTDNVVLYSILQALTFAGGIGVILLGVRMMIAEIVPAFTGIAQRIIPGAKPALDCPVMFPHAPNALLIGYVFSTLGGLVMLPILSALGMSLVIPSMIIHFFCGGSAGIFGNAMGGKRGAMIGAFVHGILVTTMEAITFPMLGKPAIDAGFTIGESDFHIMTWIMYYVGKFFAA